MSTQKQKFRNLYYVINADDVNELSNYFNEYPNENPCETKLTIGKKHDLFTHALESNSLSCIKYLIGLLTLDQMSQYITGFVYSYKYGSEIFYSFFARAKILAEETGETNIFTQLLIELIYAHHKIPQNVVIQVIEFPIYNFENKLKNNIDNTKNKLEGALLYSKSQWINLFFEYYLIKNIDFRQLAINLLLFNNGVNTNAYWKVIKKYWNLNDKSKFKIKHIEQDNIKSVHEYTLEFIIFITCDIKPTELDDFTMFTDNTFEGQFYNYITEKKDFHRKSSNLCSFIGLINNDDERYSSDVFNTKQVSKLKMVLKYLSNNFFVKLEEAKQKYIKNFKLKFHDLTIPDNFNCVDDLYQEYLELVK